MYRDKDNRSSAGNLLLANLSGEEYLRLLPHLQRVSVLAGQVVSNGCEPLSYAYFPTTCMLSLISEMKDGATSEIALIGNDGLLGTSLFLGSDRTTNSAVVGLGGEAYRMDARILRQEFSRSGLLQRTLLRYTDALMAQISLTAACNAAHTLEKRFCRWLLLTRDRTTSDEFVMTQEFIAHLLGGRRETVTVAAGHLQNAGVIHYTRGRIKIIDRVALENSACECYRAVTQACGRILAHDSNHPFVPALSRVSNSRFSKTLN